MGARDRHVVQEKLYPFVPVTLVEVLRIVLLLMVVRLIRNVDDLVKETSTER